MAQLTTFSKLLIVLGIVGFFSVVLLTCNSCLQGGNQYNQSYQQTAPVYYPQYQTVYREDGSSFVMNYLLWRSLMDQGGPNVVNNYYDSHRNEPDFQPQRQQQFRQEAENEVKTQKSSGFGSKPTQTQSSNGFGSRPVETNKSNGFGSNSSPTSEPIKSVQTQNSRGFGSSSSSSYSSPTPQSKTNSVSTTRSNGFGKKNKK